jgi:DNA-directed RNA polymerase subunit RPC12/RpoP
MKCRNARCGYEGVRSLRAEEFAKRMETRDGYGCPNCGTRRMDPMKSGRPLRDSTFTGWGWHDGLNMSFLGPRHYRDYLRANGLVEAGNEAAPVYQESRQEIWDDATLKEAADIAGGLDGGTVRYLKEHENAPLPEASDESVD